MGLGPARVVDLRFASEMPLINSRQDGHEQYSGWSRFCSAPLSAPALRQGRQLRNSANLRRRSACASSPTRRITSTANEW